MADYTDNFIKQHKDYFKRNRSLIENSGWEEIKLQKSGKNIIANNEIKDDERKHLFKQDLELVKNIQSRLSVFIKNTSSERHITKTQTFIDYTADIIQVFLDKCNTYIKENDENIIDKIKDVESRGIEILFQDYIQNNKFKIEDTLLSLNVTNSVEDLSIRFYRDDMASLLMKEPLNLMNIDVKLKTENINIDWDIKNSSEMYINMKKENIPVWNHKKHFFEQDTDVLQFWSSEFNKISEGVVIGGYFVHPWLYWHLNFFKTPISVGKKNPVINPYLRDNEWFFAENLKKTEEPNDAGIINKGMLVYGTRRFSKSVILASYTHWKAVSTFNAVATVTGGSSIDLTDLTGKVQTSMDYIEPAFKLNIQKQNWANGDTVLGVRENASNIIKYSTIRIKNLDGGTKKSSQKTAGGYSSAFVMDEIGKFDFIKPFLAALPSLIDGDGNFLCPPLLAGTGGEADLSKDAMRVLANPESFNLIPMQWDILESKIDPEFISWKRKTFATFFPAQMAHGEGMTKSKKKFSEFLGVKDDMQDLDILVSNWDTNLEYIKNIRKSVKKDKLVLQQKTVQQPIDPEDCLITTEENPFPTAEGRRQRSYLEEEGITGRHVELFRNENGLIDAQDSDKHLPEFPYNGGFCDAPVVMYEDIPQIKPPLYKYIAGLDDYKQEESSGDSVGSITIYNRETGRIAAIYNARPDPHKKFHKNCHYLLELFNAECFMENEDMGLKEYLDKLHLTDKYLVKGIDFLADIGMQSNNKRKYGWHPTPKNKNFLLGILKNNLTEEIELEDGSTMLGITAIEDIGILDEILTFKKGQNVDRITSFMTVLGYDYYLTANYITPDIPKEIKEKQKKKRSRRQNLYGKRRYNAYRS